jgi:hypothetical protein
MSRTYEEYLKLAQEQAEGGFYTKASYKEATRYLADAFNLFKMRDLPTGEFYGETIDNFGQSFPTKPELIGKEIMEWQRVDIWNFKPEKHLSEYGESAQPKVMKLYELWHQYKSMGITAKPKVKKEIKFTDRQATHWGTCQVCGKRHKVDKKYNVIAEHGYTLMYGGQLGGCYGSKHQPLELGCSVAKVWVERLKMDIENFKDRAVTEEDRLGNPVKVVEMWLQDDGYKKPVKRKVTLEKAISIVNKQIVRGEDIIANWEEKPLIPIEIWE